VQIAAAGFAALGAAAAWRSAGLNYRSQPASSRPELAARGLNYGDVQVVHFEVDNYGGGLARGAGFLFIEGDQYVGDFLGTGTLRAGERLRVYVHLMDAGLGGADFLDGAVGTTWATEDPGKAVTETLVRDASRRHARRPLLSVTFRSDVPHGPTPARASPLGPASWASKARRTHRMVRESLRLLRDQEGAADARRSAQPPTLV
jgi:hypothetical protein